MKRLVSILTILLTSMVSYAQTKNIIYECFAPFDVDGYLPLYSEPGVYDKDIHCEISQEWGYILHIVDSKDNFFRAESVFADDNISGWVKKGDIFVIIENYSEDSIINLYTDPDSKIPTGYQIGFGGEFAAIYDICGKYVLVQIISANERTHHWGWVHINHLNAFPSSNPSLSHIED